MKTDFLVIGSGAAGLSFALKAAEHGHVTLVTKGKMDECNTNYAQGGICSVTYAPDTFEKHIHDTLVCGAGKCDPAAVELVVRRAPELIRDLIAWGTKFDKTPDGRFELNREGGHTEHRILHHEDLTGAEIERALITSVRKHPNITVLEHHFAIDLLTQHHLGEFVTRHTRGLACFGAYVLNLESNEIETVLAKFTVVAAGGCGNVYSSTTNPSVATGDGIAMCHRAKAITENMEFIQFHPTSLYHPAEKPNFLITEAMRGYGAILRLQNGEEFMDKYHPMKSLAPRDVTARAIYTEMTRRGEDFVYLDVRHKDPEQTRRHFPNIYEKCLSLGIDITRDLIPVTPAAHYCCGGVKVDLNGETSIRRLYALGETSCTGLHGANRLASNSLIEAVVYADQAAKHATSRLSSVEIQEGIPDWDFEGTQHTEEMLMIIQSKREMQAIMSNYVGIVRSNLSLERALRRLSIIYEETEELHNKIKPNRELCELRNMIAVAYLVIKQGSALKESAATTTPTTPNRTINNLQENSPTIFITVYDLTGRDHPPADVRRHRAPGRR
jgi:L-aspartate oxidase